MAGIVEELVQQGVVDGPHRFGIGIDEANPIEVRGDAARQGHRLEAIGKRGAVRGLGTQVSLELLEGRRVVEGAEGCARMRRDVAVEVVMPDSKVDVGGPELSEGIGEPLAVGFPAARPDGRDDLSAHRCRLHGVR